MKNFVCWRREDALKIINPDVDAQPDAFFRAVHTEVPIRKQDPERNKTSVMSAEDVLKQFIGEPNFALVPVIGNSGSGKSHLIRWLNLSIERGDSRELLFVPKAKTNLRDIVRMLIDRLPVGAQEQYLNMLQGTGTGTLNIAAQRASILNNIQTELENDPGDSNADDKDLEEFLIKGLSGLFIDPYIREQHFIQDNSFAAELAAHVYERPEGYSPAEKRREFSLDDLPLEVGSLTKAAHATTEFLGFLLGRPQEVRQKAVEIINRHTDKAIARCLNLSGDHLIQIMNEMRENMKKSGKELVLLIEDFARLQGLDRALMQSVLDQGSDKICTLRTVFACTTGFYASLEPTVQTRASFIIDMDNPLGETQDSFNLYGLVARYMNAVRLGPKKLNTSWEKKDHHRVPFEVESACEECEHKSVCHASFGHDDGFGLYPFSKRAIEVMALRADENAKQNFNARRFQKSVLRPITQLTSNIEQGEFPPKSLLDDLGGLQNFPLDEQQKVRRQALDDADRHLTLIALWGGEARALNLNKSIQGAFGLKPLDADAIPNSDPDPKTREGAPQPAPVPIPSADADQLNRWANNNTKMTQQLANDLRPLVFDAVYNYINWDELGCPRSIWAGPSGLFKSAGVLFVNQSTGVRGKPKIRLDIPLNWEDDDNRTYTYLALSGLIESSKAGSWDIPDGHKKFVCLQFCLENWATSVTEQILALKAGPKGWLPATAALELRCLGVLLSTPQEKVPDKADLLEIGLAPFGDQTAYASSEMTEIFTTIFEKEEVLLKVIREGVAATKGGQVGSFLNGTPLIEAMKDFRGRNYTLSELPDDTELKVPLHTEVFSVARAVTSKIDSAIQKEIDLRLSWLGRVDSAFGEETDENKIADLFRKTVTEITSLDIAGSSELQVKTVTFGKLKYADAVRSVRKMKRDEKVRPWNFATSVRGEIIASDDLIKKAEDVLTRAKRKIEASMESQGYDPGATSTITTQLQEDLEQISIALEGGSNAKSN
jgi:hypothetical protein